MSTLEQKQECDRLAREIRRLLTDLNRLLDEAPEKGLEVEITVTTNKQYQWSYTTVPGIILHSKLRSII